MNRNDLYNDNICIKIYNPNEKKLIGVFANFKKASAKIGLTPKVLKNRSIDKKRIFSEYYQSDIAIRVSSLKGDDTLLIEKTAKVRSL